MSNPASKRALRALQWLLLPAVLAVSAGAQAALSENLGTSMSAMSLGNAVTADPPGIVDSMHFNPAGLANLDGDRYSLSVFAAKLRGTAKFHQPEGYDIGGWKQDPLDGREGGTFRQSFYIPGHGPTSARLKAAGAGALAFSWNKPGSPYTFATGIYATQALGYNRSKDADDPTRFMGSVVNIQRLVYLSPSVGYKLSDTLRLGVSVPVSHQAMSLAMDMRMPNVLLGIVGKLQEGFCPDNGGGNPIDILLIGLCGGGVEGRITPYKKMASIELDATAPVDITANVGAAWDATPWLSLGAAYRKGSKTVVRGRYSLHAEEAVRRFAAGMYNSLFGPVVAAIAGIPQNIPVEQSGYVQVVVPYPQTWQFGVALRPLSKVQLNIDATRAHWSDWDSLVVKFDQDIELLKLARIFGVTDPSVMRIPRGYRTRWHYGYGLEWQVLEPFALRFGYEPRKSSIPANKIDLIAPLGDMTLKSVGFRWQYSKDVELAFNYTTGKTSFNAPANSSCNMNCDNFFNVIYNPYAGLDVSGSLKIFMTGFTLTSRF